MALFQEADMWRGRPFIGVVAGLLVLGVTASLPVETASAGSTLAPRSLAHAQTIRAEVDARYRTLGRGLAITEASSTGVLESYSLLTSNLLSTRVLPAGNGIYYAICPPGATCPYPARGFAQEAASIVPRRVALELAVRTFLETSAQLVAVSLPTATYTALVIERAELARAVDLSTLAKALRGRPSLLSASLGGLVDRVTRPSVFVALSLDPTAGGRSSWAGIPRWPTLDYLPLMDS
jgi:hypothetical protein